MIDTVRETLRVWLEKWSDIIFRSGTFRVGVVALVAVGMLAIPSTAEAAELSARCSDEGDAVVLKFRNERGPVWWSFYSADDVLNYGETDHAPLQTWTFTVEIDPGTVYSFVVVEADLGEPEQVGTTVTGQPVFIRPWINESTSEMEVVCQVVEDPPPPSNPVIAPVYFDPTPSPYTFLEWIRDVYRRALSDCSRIGAYGYDFCPL